MRSVLLLLIAALAGCAPVATCGPDPAVFETEIDAEVLTIGFVRTDVPGMTIWPRYRFRRAD